MRTRFITIASLGAAILVVAGAALATSSSDRLAAKQATAAPARQGAGSGVQARAQDDPG